ncbi:N-alpha-acetyltransferase 30 [Orussus abietinus]|uniref:N-alpha-acetyltransferase 30 n=1 Tax=Orussus abietinus TaxID=222816 RepID=UPI0006267798|nr:N-alpha-acetyltransferase 30 [Orussus abietinus]XP_012274829.1 N-alpha-acetyltransferase 30 [Orussus abietinus]XP_012274830.1 N-alpha-acetyltransferase 30 [Orussus abietinus]
MENVKAESVEEVTELEATKGKVKGKKDNVVSDLDTEDIKSRSGLQTAESCSESQSNGLHQVNGVCDSPKRSDESAQEPKNVETSHSSTLEKTEANSTVTKDSDIKYVSYSSELQMPDIMRLIQKDLSEPYSIYTYRYFIHNWPKLCFLAMHEEQCVGAIVCKLDVHRKVIRRGYIAMLAVDVKYRKRKIGSNLVRRAIRAMVEDNADEVVLETEITNRPALQLYENLGFVRDKRLFRYYLNGVDALRLKLWLR